MSSAMHNHLTVVECCKCGHWRTEHRDSMLELATHAVRRAGCGACRYVGCPCEEFDFAESVTLEDDDVTFDEGAAVAAEQDTLYWPHW